MPEMRENTRDSQGRDGDSNRTVQVLVRAVRVRLMSWDLAHLGIQSYLSHVVDKDRMLSIDTETTGITSVVPPRSILEGTVLYPYIWGSSSAT